VCHGGAGDVAAAETLNGDAREVATAPRVGWGRRRQGNGEGVVASGGLAERRGGEAATDLMEMVVGREGERKALVPCRSGNPNPRIGLDSVLIDQITGLGPLQERVSNILFYGISLILLSCLQGKNINNASPSG
jgi:hypothetical protein